LVRPVPGERTNAFLRDLLDTLLAPYDDGSAADRIALSVPDIPVGQASATSLALIIHELTTNSVKYGALSVPTGALDIVCHEDGDAITVLWTERGGPPVHATGGASGYGSKLIQRSVSGQLGGSLSYTWPTSGVVVTLRMSKARLAR
jgi:two-component sensor histidine kinase